VSELSAVVGIGQTKHQATRGDVSIAGLVREAAHEALADAEMDWSDIEAVVIGKAPDFFEGVMMPELYLADALGCVGKPMLRVQLLITPDPILIFLVVAAKAAIGTIASRTRRLSACHTASKPFDSAYWAYLMPS